MMHTGTGSRGHCRKAFGHSARVAGALAMCGSVLLAAGCDRQPSPTTPGMPSSEQTHIRGLVSDTVRRPLAGALVAVLDGSLAGTTKLTDDAGKFELTGTAAGTVTLRVSRDGFHAITRALSWQQSNSTAIVEGFFRLDTLELAIGLDPGDYTLTIAIDLAASSNHRNLPQAPCAGFPVELASRSYQVTILPESSSLYDRVVRADDRPLHSETLFGFSLAGRFVGFEMDDGIPEDFPGFRFLNIFIAAPTPEPATATGSSVSIPFYGEFRYCQLKSARGIYNDCSQVPAEQIVDYHSCASDHATMMFTRR
ncbi:MAG: carboxypeptidase regulatory-like domain-containing protein [Acidobacteria bacterium]|nr:carboxypeptidase regulatory-like domain-containing protein [Acidobacteriota bacterium]